MPYPPISRYHLLPGLTYSVFSRPRREQPDGSYQIHLVGERHCRPSGSTAPDWRFRRTLRGLRPYRLASELWHLMCSCFEGWRA